MAEKKPKSIDGLMKYMRDKKSISIQGSSQKQQLRNMGYYHGYKGYRYIYSPKNQVPYSDFNEISSIYDFDAQLKGLLYPQVMFLETALKNYVLEVLVKDANSYNFTDIYTKLLTNYKYYSPVGKKFKTQKDRDDAEEKYKKALKRRLEVRDQLYRVQTKAYGNKNKIAVHYYQKDMNLPLWSIFELLSLGEFGNFIACIEYNSRKNISKNLGIRSSDDNSALLTQRLVFTIKDLRNSIAHNDVIFDVRFKSGEIHHQVINSLKNATGVQGLTFTTITDYIVLIVYMLSLFGVTKTKTKKFVREFEELCENLRKEIPVSFYNQIIHTDAMKKLTALKKFI